MAGPVGVRSGVHVIALVVNGTWYQPACPAAVPGVASPPNGKEERRAHHEDQADI